MKLWLPCIVALFCSIGCKQKKVDLSGQKPIKVNDFIAAFPILPLPYTVADTNINSIGDTINISYNVCTQFIPDSILKNSINIQKKFSIHPVGRIVKVKEVYLLVAITQFKKTQLICFVLDKKNRFLALKSMFKTDNSDGYWHSVTINKEPTFMIAKEKMNEETKQLQFTRIGWAYNGGNAFMMVINDSNEDFAKNNLIIDPIDTLPHKNKLSGNYVRDSKNFITIRDGKNAEEYTFFIHFEKKEGTCTGELKGTMKMKTPLTGLYTQSGDPCVIDFIFEGTTVSLKEQGSCGNRRGIECFFNDTFTKKKLPKPTTIKPKKTIS